MKPSRRVEKRMRDRLAGWDKITQSEHYKKSPKAYTRPGAVKKHA